jgi:hypothetical protein
MANSAGYFFLNLSISNDNNNFTLPLKLTAYNSLTYECDSSRQICKSLVTKEESNSIQNILIIVFVILGSVLIVALIVGLVSFWRYKSNHTKRLVRPVIDEPKKNEDIVDNSCIEKDLQPFPEVLEQTETENEDQQHIEANEEEPIEKLEEKIIPLQTSETDALYNR